MTQLCHLKDEKLELPAVQVRRIDKKSRLRARPMDLLSAFSQLLPSTSVERVRPWLSRLSSLVFPYSILEMLVVSVRAFADHLDGAPEPGHLCFYYRSGRANNPWRGTVRAVYDLTNLFQSPPFPGALDSPSRLSLLQQKFLAHEDAWARELQLILGSPVHASYDSTLGHNGLISLITYFRGPWRSLKRPGGRGRYVSPSSHHRKFILLRSILSCNEPKNTLPKGTAASGNSRSFVTSASDCHAIPKPRGISCPET
jgi:hypothetical protein